LSVDVVDEGVSIVAAIRERGGVLRLLGGAAVFIHCPASVSDGPYRELGDLDAIIRRGDVRTVSSTLKDRGYDEDARFNAVHGERRLIFSGPRGKLDVFVETFEMCHRIQLRDRLLLEELTLSVSDLLLTKLQIVQLNDKDARDTAALLAEHDLASGAGDHFDVDYLSSLLGSDWGLWRTVTGNLNKVAELQPRVASRAGSLVAVLDSAPKSLAFKARARIGDRVRWYQLPDEV
jgi:hypothetical protein